MECSVDTGRHGNGTASRKTINLSGESCVRNDDCNGLPEQTCVAPFDNVCICSGRDASGRCTAGRCLWHVDPATTSCVCVPGHREPCTKSGGVAGARTCNETGSAWSACS